MVPIVWGHTRLEDYSQVVFSQKLSAESLQLGTSPLRCLSISLYSVGVKLATAITYQLPMRRPVGAVCVELPSSSAWVAAGAVDGSRAGSRSAGPNATTKTTRTAKPPTRQPDVIIIHHKQPCGFLRWSMPCGLVFGSTLASTLTVDRANGIEVATVSSITIAQAGAGGRGTLTWHCTGSSTSAIGTRLSGWAGEQRRWR